MFKSYLDLLTRKEMEKVKTGFNQQPQYIYGRLFFSEKQIKIITITLLCLCYASLSLATTATVRYNSVYQQLEGFGGAACYDIQALANYSAKEEVYDLLFGELGLDILRIKNTYGISAADINATGAVVTAARQTGRNPDLKTFLVPWSPQASLKSDGTVGGLNSTLKKDASDPNNSAPYYYVYYEYAKWWLNSLTGSGGFNSVGIYPDYISIQNEPDWGIQDQVCRFDATENSTYAGYDKAFEAVFNKLDGNVSPMPKMLAPETAGSPISQTYISALISRGQLDNIYGFSHHLYGDGSFDNPDAMITGLQNYSDNYGYKPLFQTEFGANGTPTFDHALQLAQLIHNCLIYEGVTSYFHWSLFRDGSYATGGMINLVPDGNYIIRDTYWFFKHYTYFTDPNWYVIGATASPSDNLRLTAFKNPDNNQLTIVILNKSSSEESLSLTLRGFSPDGNISEMYRSTETEHWTFLGDFNETQALTLPAESITTIHLSGEQYFTPAEADVTKCTIKAGKTQGQDSIEVSGSFTDDFDPPISDINSFDVNIISADGNLIFSEANEFTTSSPDTGKFQYTHKISKDSDGAITSLKFDFNKQIFSLKAKNIDLTGLTCPIQLNIRLGDYRLWSEVNEPVVNGGKKLIPTRLMRMYKDTLVVTKANVRDGSLPSSDSLTVKGDIAVADMNLDSNEPNLATREVVFSWGDAEGTLQTFTIPIADPNNFKESKKGHVYKCNKVRPFETTEQPNALVSATIDLDKCTFTISIKNADNIFAGPDPARATFGISFDTENGTFDQARDVNVITGQPY